MDTERIVLESAQTRMKVGAAALAAAAILFPAALPGAAIDDLSAGDPAVRIKAATALAAGESVAPEAIAALVRALSDPYLDVRDGSARALAKAGSEAVAPLLDRLAGGDYHAQVWSAKALGAMGSAVSTPEAVRGLIAAVATRSVDGQRQLHAAWALARIAPKDDAFAAPLERAYLDAPDPAVKGYLVKALVGAGGGGGQASIARAVADVSTDESARQLLVAIGGRAVEALIAGLQTGDKKKAATLISVLGDIGPTAVTAIPALIKEVETPRDPWLGSFAINALAKVGPGDDRVKAVFERAANAQGGPMADAARQALARAAKREAP